MTSIDPVLGLACIPPKYSQISPIFSRFIFVCACAPLQYASTNIILQVPISHMQDFLQIIEEYIQIARTYVIILAVVTKITCTIHVCLQNNTVKPCLCMITFMMHDIMVYQCQEPAGHQPEFSKRRRVPDVF